MPTKKPSFKDYKINEKSPAIDITMEELNITRDEALKLIKEMSYRINFPKKKKKARSLKITLKEYFQSLVMLTGDFYVW
jgi:hypothetical protein